MNNIFDVADLIHELLSYDKDLSWTIDELHWGISVTQPDMSVTLDETRVAVWQLIDDVKADLTSDRKVIFHDETQSR